MSSVETNATGRESLSVLRNWLHTVVFGFFMGFDDSKKNRTAKLIKKCV